MTDQYDQGSCIGALGRGVIYGLAFFIPVALVLMRWEGFDRFVSGISRLPVLTSLSEDFEAGLGIAGKLLREQSILFYGREPNFDWLENNFFYPGLQSANTNNPYAWRRPDLERKLAARFNSKKMERARRYLDYIEEYQELAAAEMYRSWVPASITLAQALLESDAGQSYLAQHANNHFGVKCRKRREYKKDGWIDDDDFYADKLAHDCLQRYDDNPWDRFEVYASTALSYRRHSMLLAGSSRYNWMLRQYLPGEHYQLPERWFGTDLVPYYAAWSVGLQEGGYATGRNYGKKIALIIETYELWRFDYGVLLAVK